MTMKNEKAIILLASMTAIIILCMGLFGVMIPRIAFAASTSDSNNMGIKASAVDNNNTNSANTNSSDGINTANLKTTGSTEAQDTSGLNGLVLTVVPDKTSIKAGDTQGLHVKAVTDNGTAINNLPVTVLVEDYQTGKQKVVLGGKTDDKGMLDVSAAIGPHAKTSQFIAIVTADKDGKNSKVSTGFVVNEDNGGGSSSSGGSSKSTDSKGRCSGSSCR